METSEVFRRVRLHLGDDDDIVSHKRYVCYALDMLYLYGAIGDRDRTRCKRYIRGHLDGCQTLEEWLMSHHAIVCDNTPAYKKKIMATRKAWLTHLIEHYESKGD